MSIFGDENLKKSMYDEYRIGMEYGFSNGFIEGYKTGYNDGKSLKGDDIISRKEAIKAIHDEAIKAIHDEYDEITNIDESGEWIASNIEEIIQRLPIPSMGEVTE